MSVVKGILDFLFGKDPDIFDEKGNVSHNLPRKKWEAWHQRTKIDPHHNWRSHTGRTSNYSKKK